MQVKVIKYLIKREKIPNKVTKENDSKPKINSRKETAN